jgi:hypothetical protein
VVECLPGIHNALGSMIITALFIIAKLWKQARYPTTDEWIFLKMRYIYTMEFYSIIKKNEIMGVCR